MIKRILALIIVCAVLMLPNLFSAGLSYKYDDNGRLIEVNYDSGQKLTYQYDSAGNITSFKNDPGKDILTGISLDSSAYTMMVGESHETIVNIQTLGGSVGVISEGVTYNLSDTTVAQVDSNGKITGLKPGTTILSVILEDFTVTANITIIEVPDTIAPSQVKNLRLSAKTATSISLVFDPSSDNKSVIGYYLYRDNVQMAIVNDTTYVDTGLLPETKYEYFVVAYDAAENLSTKSVGFIETTNRDNEAPSKPTNLKATELKETMISLAWGASTDNVVVAGYKIYRNGLQIGTSTGLSYTNSGLEANTSYTFTVAAYDGYNNVGIMTEALVLKTNPDIQAPSVPSGLIGSNVTETQLKLSWKASTDNIGVQGYELYRDGVKIATTSLLFYTNTGLSPGVSYQYSIASYDKAGNQSNQSVQTVVKTLADTKAPTIPQGLTGKSVNGNSASLTWTASTDNIGIKNYNVFRNSVQIGTTTELKYTNTKLKVGTSYKYKIQAVDKSGNVSGFSNEVTIKISIFNWFQGLF